MFVVFLIASLYAVMQDSEETGEVEESMEFLLYSVFNIVCLMKESDVVRMLPPLDWRLVNVSLLSGLRVQGKC